MIKFYEQKDLAVFKIFGIDAVRYLNGRITQDVKNLPQNEAKMSLILNPQGKAEGKFLITKKEDFFLVVAETSSDLTTEIFLKNLFRFKVSDQVFSESLDTIKVFTLFDVSDSEIIDTLNNNSSFIKVKRGGNITYDFFTDLSPIDYIKDNLLESEKSTEIIQSTDKEYLDFRIRSKFPLIGIDIGPKVSGTDIPLGDYVSFTKGCYAGQEVVEMSQARGRANKKLVTIISDQGILSEDSLKIYNNLDDTSSKEVGFITSFLNNESGFTALGFVKNDSDLSSSFYILNSANEHIAVNLNAA